jgi:hypothetical protein
MGGELFLLWHPISARGQIISNVYDVVIGKAAFPTVL